MSIERVDTLIGRTVDGSETASEWTELCDAADRQPENWRELAIQQRQARLLTGTVRDAATLADAVELPRSSAQPASVERDVVGRIGPGAGPDASHAGPGRWLGWVVAACIAGFWMLSGMPGANRGAVPVTNTAGFAFDTPDDALEAYIEKGRADGLVVGELPSKVLIDSRPVADGEGFEVLFVRQIIERRSVPALFDVSQSDEHGRPVPVRIIVGTEPSL